MERKMGILTLYLLLFFGLYTNATHKSDIYQAYISNNMKQWKTVLENMEKEPAKTPDFLLELVNYQYGYIGWCIGNQKNDEAKLYIEKGENILVQLEKNSFKLSYVYAYKSAFYGFRIGLNKMQAPFIGPRSVDFSKLAMKTDENNPFGFIQYANSQYYMPAMFGGSKKTAVDYYEKAKIIMENQSETLENDWNYLSLLTTIAQAYTELKLYKTAELYYKKILKIEPEFTWVKNELYPELLKKMK
jgi:hypothetical protein